MFFAKHYPYRLKNSDCVLSGYWLYFALMNRITAYFLLFFVLFTHNAIAMDVHLPVVSGHDSSLISVLSDDNSDPALQSSDLQGCGDLGGHCSHSASHISGFVSSIALPSLQIQRIFIPVERNIALASSQSPPDRPPKA